jgi:hypothetical protein
VGWVVVDVAPQRSLDAAPPPPDEDLQQLLAELLRGETPLPTDGTEAPRPLDESARALGHLLAVAIEVLLALSFWFTYTGKLWRRLAPVFASEATLPRLAYRAMLDVLGEAGIRRAPGESREGFAARVRDRVPSLTTLTDAHAAVAYASRVRPTSAAVRAASVRAHQEHAEHVPLWRRLLGLANPFSWLWTR